MKTKIGAGLLVLVLCLVVFKSQKPELSLSRVIEESTKKVFTQAKEAKVEVAVKDEAKTEIPDLATLEEELVEKSNEEIRKAIEQNNEWGKKENFIARANDNKLDEAGSRDFVKYIRLNNVLHKILIDRQIEEMERN